MKAIQAFWQTIWNRNGPSSSDAFQNWCLHTPRAPVLPWNNLRAQEMYTQAKKQRGLAAGPDAFSGTEVSELRLRAWEILEILLDRWISRGELPSVWQSVRPGHSRSGYASHIDPVLHLAYHSLELGQSCFDKGMDSFMGTPHCVSRFSLSRKVAFS